MSDKEILEIIKNKRHSCYCDYECNIRLNMTDDNILSRQARKDHIKGLIANLKVYDELISMLESN